MAGVRPESQGHGRGLPALVGSGHHLYYIAARKLRAGIVDSRTSSALRTIPDDGNRYEAIEGDLYMTPAREYWIVDPDENAVDVWRFAEDPAHKRFEGTLPVRLEAEQVGEIDLRAVFDPNF